MRALEMDSEEQPSSQDTKDVNLSEQLSSALDARHVLESDPMYTCSDAEFQRPRHSNALLRTLAPRASEHLVQEGQKEHKQLNIDLLFKERAFQNSDWHKHCSYRRYLPQAGVFTKVLFSLGYPLSIVLGSCLGCGIYQEYIRHKGWPNLDNLDLDLAYSLCSFALSLLLVFKTNTAYARFWEARTMWGAMYTNVRTFMVRVKNYGHGAPLRTRQALLRWAIALPYVCRSHFLDYDPGADALEVLLTDKEVEWLRDVPPGMKPHQPLKAASMLSEVLRTLDLDPILLQDLQNVMEQYLRNVGALERIALTPIPLPYTRHTVRFLLIYTFFTPFALWRHVGWFVFLVCAILVVLLAGIEDIGIMLENPLLRLPMAAYCASMQNNLQCLAYSWAHGDPCEADYKLVTTIALDPEPPKWQHAATTGLVDCGGCVKDPSE